MLESFYKAVQMVAILCSQSKSLHSNTPNFFKVPYIIYNNNLRKITFYVTDRCRTCTHTHVREISAQNLP